MACVCACVLTRNRKGLLVECLTGLLAQTEPVERILVVDNASSDGTEELLAMCGLLDRAEVAYVRLERNRGGAGGYAELVARGRELGTEWLWLMDDDAEPHPEALERLLGVPEADDGRTAALCTSVVRPDGTLEVLHRGYVGRFMRALPAGAYRSGEHPEVGFGSFVGFLVRTSVARALEPPRADFFIACDDVEYSIRVRAHGAIRLVPESVLVHKLGMGGGTRTWRSRFWNRLLGVEYSSIPWPHFWKSLYGIRNFLWIKHRYGQVRPLAFVGLTAVYVVKSLLYDERPLRRVPWIVAYARKGRRGDLTGVTPEEWLALAGET